MVMAEEENMTVIRSPLIAAGLDVLRLDLRYRDRSVTLEEPMPEFVLGRQDICDLVIDSSYASRRHATIQAVRGKVFLKDHSTNGTYVRNAADGVVRSEEHTSELQSLMRISYAVFCLKTKNSDNNSEPHIQIHINNYILSV